MPDEMQTQGDDFKTKVNKFMFGSVESFGKYLAGKAVASIIVGVSTYLFCYFMGIKPSWLLAIIAAFGNMIPIVGPWAVMIICALIAVFQVPINALYIAVFCIGIQAVDQFLITPLVVGKSVDLSPLLIIVVVTIASIFLGFWGLIFAVPIASVIKLAYTIFIKQRNKKDETSKNQPERTQQ